MNSPGKGFCNGMVIVGNKIISNPVELSIPYTRQQSCGAALFLGRRMLCVSIPVKLICMRILEYIDTYPDDML